MINQNPLMIYMIRRVVTLLVIRSKPYAMNFGDYACRWHTYSRLPQHPPQRLAQGPKI